MTVPDLDAQLDEQQVTIRHAIDALPETHDNELRAMFAVRDLNRLVADLRAARADNQRLREALAQIAKWGTKFDARGTHSQRVVDHARAALSEVPRA